jgi:UDP-2,4-diacetamido-2,4,6-trideoxy-beta-L-altropyranose hydrolase
VPHESSLLVVRADAGPGIGGGHVMRCLALAQAWVAQGGRLVFFSHCTAPLILLRLQAENITVVPVEASHPDPRDLAFTLAALSRLTHADEVLSGATWFVIDGYHFDEAYHEAIRSTGCRLLVIDDTAHLQSYRTDVLLNQNIAADQLYHACGADTILLLGPRYALLRSEFLVWREWIREIPETASKILVTLGAADPENVTAMVAEELLHLADQPLRVRIIQGPASSNSLATLANKPGSDIELEILSNPENLPELMAWADVAVAAGGSTCWEFLFMGLPAILVIVAENQRGVASGLGKHGLAINAGALDANSQTRIGTTVTDLVHDKASRERLARLGRMMVDGRGAARCVEILRSFRLPGETSRLSLRLACQEDAVTLWQWANDPVTRRNSFEDRPVPWDGHFRWVTEKLTAPDTRIWILEKDCVPVGQIRCDRIDGDTAQISYSVDRAHRGKGLGAYLLSSSFERACTELDVKRIEAHVLVQNSESLRSLEKAGYQRLTTHIRNGKDSFVLIREASSVNL